MQSSRFCFLFMPTVVYKILNLYYDPNVFIPGLMFTLIRIQCEKPRKVTQKIKKEKSKIVHHTYIPAQF